MILYYKFIHFPAFSQSPLILISDIDNGGSGEHLTLKITGTECTYALINGKRYKITSACAKIPLSEIQNGICNVVFTSGTKRLCASPFFKTDAGIERIPIDSEGVKALETLLVSICKRLCEAEEKITSLEEKTIPKDILKFN